MTNDSTCSPRPLAGRRVALFDFDGTLADTAPGIVRAATETLAEWGMSEADMGDVARLVGPALPGAFRLVYGVSEADDAELTARYRARYEQLGPESYPLFPGMGALLERLRAAGWKLAIATSKRQHRCVAMLDALGVLDRFDVVMGQHDGIKDKKTLIGLALQELGATPDEAVMVGDRGFDVEGAHANGVACAGVHFGFPPRAELEDAGAEVVVDNVFELGRALLGDALPAVGDRSCVLFDFDGTLADTKAGIVATAEKVLREWGMSDEEIGDAGRLVGPPFPGAFTEVYGMSPEDAAEVTRRYRAVYVTLGPDSHPLFDGIPELLRDLKAAGRRVATASAKRQTMVSAILEEMCVADLFDVVIGQTDPTRSEKATLVAQALEGLGCSADEAVMVGDRFYDVEGALANDVPCVGVRYGNTSAPGELEHAGAAAVVGSVAALRRVLLDA